MFQIFRAALPCAACAKGTLDSNGFICLDMNELVSLQCPVVGKGNVIAIGREIQGIFCRRVIDQAIRCEDNGFSAVGNTGLLRRLIGTHSTAGYERLFRFRQILTYKFSESGIFRS